MWVFICVCVFVRESVSYNVCFYGCVETQIVPPNSGLPLSHWWGNKPWQRRPADSTALVRLTARINLECVKKRQGCNYPETEGQRDGSLFATAWTLLLSKTENGIYLLQRKENALSFCPFVSQRVPPPCHMRLHSVVMASFLPGHLCSLVNGISLSNPLWSPSYSERKQSDMHSQER